MRGVEEENHQYSYSVACVCAILLLQCLPTSVSFFQSRDSEALRKFSIRYIRLRICFIRYIFFVQLYPIYPNSKWSSGGSRGVGFYCYAVYHLLCPSFRVRLIGRLKKFRILLCPVYHLLQSFLSKCLSEISTHRKTGVDKLDTMNYN
jgi:hypothetical protein